MLERADLHLAFVGVDELAYGGHGPAPEGVRGDPDAGDSVDPAGGHVEDRPCRVPVQSVVVDDGGRCSRGVNDGPAAVPGGWSGGEGGRVDAEVEPGLSMQQVKPTRVGEHLGHPGSSGSAGELEQHDPGWVSEELDVQHVVVDVPGVHDLVQG